MRAFIPKAISAAIAALLLVSCLNKGEYLYTDTGMCTRIGADRLQTDSGAIYNIVENSSGSNFSETSKRVMISCDVQSAVPGTTNEYNIRLIDFREALVDNPFTASAVAIDTLGNDGVNVVQAWVSGGYLNSYLNITVKSYSDTPHDIRVLYDDVRSNSDTLYFQMRHNAHGESPENPDMSFNQLSLAGLYASFPINGILPVGGKYPIVHLEWDWYIDDSSSYSREKSTRSGNLKIE